MAKHAELCRHCGRDTSAGSSLFARRVRIGQADAFEFVCPTCVDEHPVLGHDGVALSKERLAALTSILPDDG